MKRHGSFLKQVAIIFTGCFLGTLGLASSIEKFYEEIGRCRWSYKESDKSEIFLSKYSSNETSWGSLDSMLARIKNGSVRSHLTGDPEGRKFVDRNIVLVVDSDRESKIQTRADSLNEYLDGLKSDVCKIMLTNQANVYVVDLSGKPETEKKLMIDSVVKGLNLGGRSFISEDQKISAEHLISKQPITGFFVAANNVYADTEDEYYNNLDPIVEKAKKLFVQTRAPSSSLSFNETPGSCPNPVQDAAEPLPEKTQIPLSDLTKALVDATSKSPSSTKEASI